MQKLFIFIATFLFALSLSANATIVEIISVAELVEKSNLVVVGTATKKESYYIADSSMILTDVHIKITNEIRGECDDEIVVVLEGGTVGERTTFVLDGPVFSIGKEVLLCIEKIKDSKKYRVFGFNQGKFDIEDGKVYRNFNNTTFIMKSNLELELNKAKNGISLNYILNRFKLVSSQLHIVG